MLKNYEKRRLEAWNMVNCCFVIVAAFFRDGWYGYMQHKTLFIPNLNSAQTPRTRLRTKLLKSGKNWNTTGTQLEHSWNTTGTRLEQNWNKTGTKFTSKMHIFLNWWRNHFLEGWIVFMESISGMLNTWHAGDKDRQNTKTPWIHKN